LVFETRGPQNAQEIFKTSVPGTNKVFKKWSQNMESKEVPEVSRTLGDLDIYTKSFRFDARS